MEQKVLSPEIEAMYKELDAAENDKKKGRAKRAWKIVGNALFIAIVALLLFALVWVQTAKEKGETPAVFGLSLYTVRTGSMEPTLPVGCLILTKKVTDATSLEKGDIIVFENPSAPDSDPVVHRIIDKTTVGEKVFYVTKGDNNDAADGVFASDKIIAKFVVKLF